MKNKRVQVNVGLDKKTINSLECIAFRRSCESDFEQKRPTIQELIKEAINSYFKINDIVYQQQEHSSKMLDRFQIIFPDGKSCSIAMFPNKKLNADKKS